MIKLEIEKIIAKLNFYIGFLDVFIPGGERILDKNHLQSLKLTREWMIEAIKKLREFEKL